MSTPVIPAAQDASRAHVDPCDRQPRYCQCLLVEQRFMDLEQVRGVLRRLQQEPDLMTTEQRRAGRCAEEALGDTGLPPLTIDNSHLADCRQAIREPS